jgi:hypothetical protein
MGLGGPVWHASTAPAGIALPEPALRELAYDVLGAVGDSSLGQWEESGERAFHLRRRLSEREQRQVGPVLDVRRSHDGWKRWAAMQALLPPSMQGGPVL